MTDGPVGALDLVVDRLVLEGVSLPAAAMASLSAIVEAELRRIFDGGGPPTVGSVVDGERRPLLLATPPGVPALGRELAERIAAQVRANGAWDA
jgi:hypothetical protein